MKLSLKNLPSLPNLNFSDWFVKENRQDQYNQAAMALMALQYSGQDILKGKDEEILAVLRKLGKMPRHSNPHHFLAQMRMIANGSFNANQDLATGSEYPEELDRQDRTSA